MRGRPVENVVKKTKYIIDYGDSKWHYNLNKFPNGPYLVEHFDPTYDKLEKLYNKNDGYSPDKSLKRIASIPSIVLEIWAKEYNGDQNNGNWFALPKEIQTKILKEKLNSSDYRYFRTAPGKF